MSEQKWQESEDRVKQELLDLVVHKSSWEKFQTLNEVNTEKLLQFRAVTTQIVTSLNSQFAQAQRRYHEEAISSDPRWRKKVKSSAAYYSQITGTINTIIKQRNIARVEDDNAKFKQAARRILPKELFEKIEAESKK